MRQLLLFAAFSCLILNTVFPDTAALAAVSAAPDYRLGVGDQLRIRVFEWRAATGDVHQWDALKGEYAVGADGSIAMPLLGTIKASGLTTTQLADAISDELQSRLKLSIRPEASIDVVQYRPFFITGDVNKPGAYPYQPGLTVLQAISIAGGRYRVNDPALVLNATGDLWVNRLAYSELLAQRARLQAQLSNANAMTLPPELQRLQNDPGTAEMIRQQEAIFVAQRNSLNSQTNALSQLKATLNSELDSLQGKTKNIDQELSLMQQELSSTTNLVQRGLAIAPRAYELRQTQLQTEGRRLDVDTAILRAKEDVAKADQAMIELRNKTHDDAETELAQVEQKLRETSARMTHETTIAGSDAALRSSNGGTADDPAAMCLILRRSGGISNRIEGNEDAAVEPGDTIEVAPPSAGMASLDIAPTVAAAPPSAPGGSIARPSR